MNRLAEQAYLRTRLAILDSRRRRPADFDALMRLPTEQLLAALGLPETVAANRRWMDDLEQALLQKWLNELSALLRPMKGASRDVLIQWARRYEVLNLKALIRGKLGELSRDEIKASLFQLPGFLRLDHDHLMNAENVVELLRALDGTPYHNLARIGLRRFEEKQDPFILDATLDQQFYSDLVERMSHLDAIGSRAMNRLLGRIVDRHNLIALLRYRFNYGLQPAEALYLAVPGGLHLPRARLYDVADAEDLMQCLDQLPAPIHALVEGSRDILDVDRRLVADLCREAERSLRQSRSITASAFGYLTLRYYELRTLHAILQARLNGLPDSVLDDTLGSGRARAA